jgi:hypothetical protein
MLFDTSRPPASRVMFQVIPKSSRSISGVALEGDGERDVAGHPVDGQVAVHDAARARPLDRSAAERGLRVALDVEQLGRAQVLVPAGVAGGDGRHVDHHVDARVAEILGDGDRAGDAGQPAADLGDHEVTPDERHVGVAGVEIPDAGDGQHRAVDDAGGGGGGGGGLGRVARLDPVLDPLAVRADVGVAEVPEAACDGVTVAARLVRAVGHDRGVLVGEDLGRAGVGVGLDEVERAGQVLLVVVRRGKRVDQHDGAGRELGLELVAGDEGEHGCILSLKVRVHAHKVRNESSCVNCVREHICGVGPEGQGSSARRTFVRARVRTRISSAVRCWRKWSSMARR